MKDKLEKKEEELFELNCKIPMKKKKKVPEGKEYSSFMEAREMVRKEGF